MMSGAMKLVWWEIWAKNDSLGGVQQNFAVEAILKYDAHNLARQLLSSEWEIVEAQTQLFQE